MALVLGSVVVAGCTPSPSPSAMASDGASSLSAAPVRVDRSLLAHLPPEVSGLTVEYSPDGSADAAASTELRGADALAYAVAHDEATGDLVVATVVRPAAGALDEPALRQLRDTYATAVCAGVGGLRGNAESELGGRLVHIATCATGGHAYSTRLAQSGAVVLAFSRGDRRLGEELMARLRDQ